MLNPTIFREYDLRGIVDQDINIDGVVSLGRAFGTYLKQHQVDDAVLGWDSRASSPAYREAVTEGLTASGVNVLDIGQVTTPIFYWARIHYQLDGGVMITASHNPAEYNGFKLAYGPGTIFGDEIQNVRRILEAGEFTEGKGVVRHDNPVPAYLKMLHDKIQLGPRPLKVVVDCGNGTPSLFVRETMKAFGLTDVTYLYCDVDPTFPNHHPDPVVAKNLTDLIARVSQQGADLGVAFDGDGDRIGVVDERGQIIWGDRLMIVYWREILARHPNVPAIVEVKCSKTLVDEIQRLGGRPLFYKTGHSLIKNKMRELNAVFTGEMSGHMFFADEYYGFDDAFYAAGRLFRILSNTSASLSQLLAEVPELPSTPEVRIDCPDAEKFRVVERLRAQFGEDPAVRVIDIDGMRADFGYGWGLVRASNTQPALVARAEADTRAHLGQIIERLETALRQFPFITHIPWDGE